MACSECPTMGVKWGRLTAHIYVIWETGHLSRFHQKVNKQHMCYMFGCVAGWAGGQQMRCPTMFSHLFISPVAFAVGNAFASGGCMVCKF